MIYIPPTEEQRKRCVSKLDIPSFLRERFGKQCICKDTVCEQCLAGDCKDDNCQIHTKERKEKFKKASK